MPRNLKPAKRLPCMPEKRRIVVADSSVIINLNATERASDILDGLPFKVLVTDTVAGELSEDRKSGRRDRELLDALVRSGYVSIVSLSGASLELFGDLVIGSADQTLDDGEAATIAYAVEHGSMPVIDERKAQKICRQCFPSLQTLSTVDLLADPGVANALGRDHLAEAVFLALRNARVRVVFERLSWVIELIGNERASLCPSLPKATRRF
jgi:predicted nucleic acid-binding protein